jgi:hypothetical protein
VARTTCNFLFDRGAILSTNQHFWQAASKSGYCLLPQLVVDEIKRIAEEASPNPAQNSASENSAIEFIRYLPKSKWQITDLLKSHAELNTSDNQLSRNARLSILVGQYAYGVAEEHPDRLTVMVTDDQALIRKINELNIDQLCATTAIATKQWVFVGEIPSVVERAEGTFKLGQKIAKHGFRPLQNSNRGSISIGRIALNLAGIGMTALVLGLGSLFAWQHFQPQQFRQFWQKTGLPNFSQPKPR